MKKLIIFVDGDNEPAMRQNGIDLLQECDEVHIFETKKSNDPAKGMHFSEACVNGLKKRTSAKIYVTPVRAGSQSVDLRIAMELAAHRIAHLSEDNIYAVISGDTHYDIMSREFREMHGEMTGTKRFPTIRDCVENYIYWRADTPENLQAQLKKLYGELLGYDAYKNLAEVFKNQSSEDKVVTSINTPQPPVKWWRRSSCH